MIFIQENITLHSVKLTTEYLAPEYFKSIILIEWSLVSQGINPTAYLWYIIKRDVSEKGEQYSSKIMPKQ